MSNLTSTTSVTRTRSARAPSHLNKQLLNSARGIAGTTGIPPSASATTSATSATTAAPPPPTTPLPTVSNLSLFLTNLRLLDFDQRPDWPDINTLTFSNKDAAQGQKKRIQCVEWALYHLFALWDHEETRNKLQPFFPPNDQVQSLNLRAALLRGLEQAKKNGVLGRDAVVRKTMLDECKGERLEEVLAVFSSAVLKKMVAEQQLKNPGHPALAQSLALENRGYAGERTELTAMILAHKVSLRRVLDDKNTRGNRLKDFSELLTSKEMAIAQRREQAKVSQKMGETEEIPDSIKRKVRRTVRDNWTGDERWMDALLCGDANTHKDGVLSAPFDRVWRRVQSGRLEELEENSVGLLEQLDDRVKSQKDRLEKWQGFREKMFGKAGTEKKVEEPEYQRPRGISLGFRGHETLHISRTSSKKLATTHTSNFDHEYEMLIKNLKGELASISPEQPQIPAFFLRSPGQDRPHTGFEMVEPESEEISDISDHEKTPVPVRPLPPRREPIRLEPVFEPVLRKAQNFEDDLPQPTTPSRLRRAATITHSPKKRPSIDMTARTQERRLSSPPKPSFIPSPQSKSTGAVPMSPPPARRTIPRSPPQQMIPKSPPSLPSPDPPSSPGEPQSPTQELADQILASVNATSPSPVKKPRHTLSLVERTRLSMARRTSQANLRVEQEQEHDDTTPGEDDYLADPTPDPLLTIRRPTNRNPVIVPIPASPTRQANPEPEAETPTPSTGYEDLVARTRRSMAGFEAARQKAQIERRKSLKRSKLPATPAGQRFPALGEDDEEDDVGNNTTLIVEELLNEGKDDDYEAVFMSRPKIATSPVATPAAKRFSWGLE
ncbi:HAUS augmin-like complex subunit 6 N-terminus-domain-containing protein [Podospora fimiseda]|uniref:HAUS augmin-like complex subunit 6 N-terminus-domain-containing protein n=1 Tax=Podospora fimiseda TaxID=252190 RepID=A0AAN7BGT4_9PEZI|nr:HAUS augmin-like complex subunit 6 N-terminus-domain-containing protein [Podospora fimiseda]